MNDRRHANDRRIARNHYTPTLSTDWRGVARACHVAAGLPTPERPVDAVTREVVA